jgi:hypothetical protein
MSGFKQLAAVCVLAGITFPCNPTEKYGRDADPTRAELNRASTRGEGSRDFPLALKEPHDYGNWLRAKRIERMPPTSCRTVEPVRKHADSLLAPFLYGPHSVHHRALSLFEHEGDLGERGAMRMVIFEKDRVIDLFDQTATTQVTKLDKTATTPVMRDETVPPRVIDRVELVSLLINTEPSVYVFGEKATPARVRQAKRRPLDEFERLGLDALRRGEELVWTRAAPTRMFGAIRAKASCLVCHPNAKAGDLLGAFTYYLNTPVDRLDNR